MQVEVTTWYLEMLSPDQLIPKDASNPDLSILHAAIPSPEFSRFLYTSVGANWYWCDRLSWSDDQWYSYLARPEVQTWVAYVAGTPAGYVELEAQPGQNVEIVYFGLLPLFIGQGIGGHLLSVGTQHAWAMGAKRVWVHTCSLDSPHALRNYQRRGFQVYEAIAQSQTLPETPPELWQSANHAIRLPK